MKTKSEFLRLLARETGHLPEWQRTTIYTMALGVAEETIPADVHCAAKRLAQLAAKIRHVPAAN